MRKYVRVRGIRLDGRSWSASRLESCSSTDRSSGTQWIGYWIDHRSGLDAVDNIAAPAGILTSSPSSSCPHPSAGTASV
jgi:hypothetical protein